MSNKDQTIHHSRVSSNGGNPSKAVNSSSPFEPSRTFHGGIGPRGSASHPFLLALASPPSPHSNYFPQRELLFRARSKCLRPANKPTRPGNSVSEPEANTRVSVGRRRVVGGLSRAFNTANNNLPTRDFLSNFNGPTTNDHPTRPENSVSKSEPNLANANNHPKRGCLCRERSSLAQAMNFFSKSEASTHHVGLGVVGDLARAPNNSANKNLLHRSLVTTHFPLLTNWAPPVKVSSPNPNPSPNSCGPRAGGLHTRLGTYLMERVSTRFPYVPSTQNGGVVNVNTTLMSNEHVRDDNNYTVDMSNSPRKRVKRSSEAQGSRLGGSYERPSHLPSYPTSAFMRYCYTCARKLRHNRDIYILRGEMAFCSDECREREIFIQEQREMMAEASSSASTVFRRNETFRSLREPSSREG